MREIVLTGTILVLTLSALPLTAGDEKPRCEGDITECVEQMASKFKNRGWVGINLDYGKDDSGKTVLTGIVPDSPAEAAGLQAGDVLVELNGVAYTHENEQQLYAEYEKNRPGDKVTFKVDRGGKEMNIDVTLAQLPDQLMAQWIGYHVLEAHLAADEVSEEPGEIEQAKSGD